MSTHENVQNVKGFSSAARRGDKQSLLALSAERIKWIEDPGFLDDVLHGLSAPRRSVPSRWLYDHRGSALFEEITRLEDPDRLLAVFGLVAAEPAQGS